MTITTHALLGKSIFSFKERCNTVDGVWRKSKVSHYLKSSRSNSISHENPRLLGWSMNSSESIFLDGKLTSQAYFGIHETFCGSGSLAKFNSVHCTSSVVQPFSSDGSQTSTEKESKRSDSTQKRRVVVLGGSGRIGRSTARSLLEFSRSGQCEFELSIVISGRNEIKGEQACQQLGGNTEFLVCDIENDKQLLEVLKDADLVVHTAGPFQRKDRCAVLEAAILTKTPYIDVCDDMDYSQRARSLHDAAKAAGVPAITTAGIYPGVSNLMAAELVRLALEEENSVGCEPKSLRFSYYTAGSGGAGPTILATSYLLLGEQVVAYKDGKELLLKPYSNHRLVDFGKKVGKKSAYLLNLPEVRSAHSVLGIPTVSARFGTDPPFWNWAMELMVALVPPEILKDEEKVRDLVKLTDPLVRFVDSWAGEKMAIRVDLESQNGRKAASIYSHKMLSICVGQATAAFALAVLEGKTQPGVWFPEEEGGVASKARSCLLDRSSKGTLQYIVNKSPWVIEADAKQVGMGLYLDF